MHQFNVLCRTASRIDRVTDNSGFYCILLRRNTMIASGVDSVFKIIGEEKRHVCVLCLSGQHETHKSCRCFLFLVGFLNKLNY